MAAILDCLKSQGTSDKQLAFCICVTGTESPAHQKQAPNAPLVDLPEGQVLDSLDLLNKVERQCIDEEVPDLLILCR